MEYFTQLSIKTIFLNVLIILLTILFFPLCLLSPLLFLPLYLWRALIGILGKYFDPKNLELMSPRNSVVAIDTHHTQPEQSIVIIISLTGDLDSDLFYKRLESLILTPTSLYPKLQKFYEPWAGYLFWRQDEEFNLKNHFKIYQPQNPAKVTHEELEQFCLDLVREPYPYERSPWEIIQVNNFTRDENSPESKTVVIFRAHHGLCDGFSILQFLTSTMDQWQDTKDKLPTAMWAKGAVKPTIWHYALMTLLTPYNLIRQSIGSYDSNSFRLRESQLTKKLWTAQVQVEVNKIKEIKQKWGVTFSTVVYSALIGGFRNFMLNQKIPVPQYFHVGAPFPWPNRRSDQGLQNNMCVCILELPVGMESIKNRVKYCEANWLKIKRSTIPLMNWTLMPLMGLLPASFVKLFIQNNLTTMVFSNFPGPQSPIQVLGTTTDEIEFITGFWRGNCGIGIGLISSNGLVKINLGVDKGILPLKSQVEKIKDFIQTELNNLSQGPPCTV